MTTTTTTMMMMIIIIVIIISQTRKTFIFKTKESCFCKIIRTVRTV